MTSAAAQRALGWSGPGDPGSAQETAWKTANLVKADSVPVVKTVWVHRNILPMANALMLFLQKSGAKLGENVDDWGFANRPIRNAKATDDSYHKYARALDLDALENVQHSGKTTFPVKNTNEVCKLLGFEWGMNFKAPWNDPMHFQWPGSRARAKYIRSRLRKSTKRSKRLAVLCGMTTKDFIARIN